MRSVLLLALVVIFVNLDVIALYNEFKQDNLWSALTLIFFCPFVISLIIGALIEIARGEKP